MWVRKFWGLMLETFLFLLNFILNFELFSVLIFFGMDTTDNDTDWIHEKKSIIMIQRSFISFHDNNALFIHITPRFVSNFIGIIKNTHTSNILSPFLMPAFSAAPRSKTALTCCNGAYNSPLILLNCPPNDNKPRMNHQDMQFGTNKWLVCEKNWKICFEERKNVLYGFVYVLEQDEKKNSTNLH